MAERLAGAALVLGLLAACASQTELRRSELAQLADWLPGRYESLAPAGADGQPQERLALAIVPVYAPRIGELVFYLHETAADDPRRVTEQRLLSFEVSEDGRIVQSLWTLEDPPRWREAHAHPDLFKGLMPQDVSPMPGCELLWSRTDAGFSGANDPQRCRMISPATGGTVFVEMRAELGPEELVRSALPRKASGEPVQARAGEASYRFRRR